MASTEKGGVCELVLINEVVVVRSQSSVQMIPLMLVGGYEADGWLGLLLGASLWYVFYPGKVLDSDAEFESRVTDLARGIGPRGLATSGA